MEKEIKDETLAMSVAKTLKEHATDYKKEMKIWRGIAIGLIAISLCLSAYIVIYLDNSNTDIGIIRDEN